MVSPDLLIADGSQLLVSLLLLGYGQQDPLVERT